MNKHLLALTIITICAFLIRFQNLGTMSLWLDEIWSVTNALEGPTHILISQDPARSFPFHLVLNVFLQFGNNEFNARLPSLIFGVLAIPLIYFLGKELFNKNVGLLSAFMLSFWPYHIWYSQEARMYSLFFLVTTTSMLALVKTVRTKSWRMWLLFCIVTVLGFYTHFYYVFVFGVQILYLLYVGRLKLVREMSLKYLTPTVVCGLFLFPWVEGAYNMFLHGPALNIPWGLQPNVFWVETLSYLSIGLFGILFAVPLVTVGLWYGFKNYRNQTVLLATWVLAPTIFLFALTILLRPLTGNRYLIFVLPAWLMLLANGLIMGSKRLKSNLPERKQIFMSFYLSVIIFGTLAVPTIVLMPQTSREDWRDAVAVLLAETYGKNELVIAYPGYIDRPLSYYLGRYSCSDFRFETYGTIDLTMQRVETAMKEDLDVWVVLYSWGEGVKTFENRLSQIGEFELVKMYYQIWIYHKK